MKGAAWVLFLSAFLSVASLAPSGPSAAAERDRDCDEFRTQAAAQHFFVTHGGSRSNDFDNLDGDGDGVACESNPCPCSKAADGGAGSSKVPAGRRLAAVVTRDVDGDSIYVRLVATGSEIEVRVIGIDTPEEYRPDTPVECGARAAARSMTKLVDHHSVVLTTDPTQDRFDRYGRLLAYVEFGGKDLGKAQIRRGWAMTYVFDGNPFRRTASYRRAETAARGEGRGVWGMCHGNFHTAEPGKQS